MLIFFALYCLLVKAKTVGEVIKNRPAAGILDAALAEEYKVIYYFSLLFMVQLNKLFHVNTNEIPGELLSENISSHIKKITGAMVT